MLKLMNSLLTIKTDPPEGNGLAREEMGWNQELESKTEERFQEAPGWLSLLSFQLGLS